MPVSKNTVTGVFWVMANTRVRMVSGMTASREAVAAVSYTHLGVPLGNTANFTAFRKAVPLGKMDASETSRRKGCFFMHHNIRRTTG